MNIKIKGKEYQVRDSNCKKLDCFVPFSGNGQNICRLYELGQCPSQAERKELLKKKASKKC